MTADDRPNPYRPDGQEILARLREAKENIPELTEIVDLQHDMLKAQMQAEVRTATPQYSAEELRALLREGVPLLRPQEMASEWEHFSNLYGQLCRIAARHRPDLASQFEGLLTLLDDDPIRVQDLVTTYLEEDDLMGIAAVRETENEEERERRELLTFVFNHALHPFLRAHADTLMPMLEQIVDPHWDKLWQRRNCPICGGEPDLALLDAKSGARRLVCSRCDSQWLYPRLGCPFCESTDYAKISYYLSDDGSHRLYICDDCKRYLKTVDLRRAGRRLLIEVERITTADLDVAARQEGYH